jgi:hypothetical protein
MTQMRRGKLRAVALAVLACGTSLVAVPVVHAQEGTVDEIRLRKLEAEVRALQRQVFPGGDPKFFPSDGSAPAAPTPQPGSPATTPVTDLLTRMDALEGQNARLTAQVEEMSNRLRKMESAAPSAPGSSTVVTPPPTPARSRTWAPRRCPPVSPLTRRRRWPSPSPPRWSPRRRRLPSRPPRASRR